jgi:hypothetical protein
MRALASVAALWLTFGALMASVGEAVAQTPPPFEPGARLRVLLCVTACAREPVVGTFVGLSGDTLLWQAEGSSSPLAAPMESVGRLWVSEGEHGWGGLKGAGVGLVVGGLAGLAGAAVVMEDCYEAECIVGLIPLVGFTVAGPIVGGLLAKKRERWREVQPSRLSVQVGPALEGRLGLRVALRF